jgi:hypothetical protein
MEITTVQSIKLAIMAATDLSRDALHIYAGLTACLAASLIFRRPLRSLVPLSAAIAIAVFVEMLDLRDDLVTFGYWRLKASLHDIVNTIFWPLVLFVLARGTSVFGMQKK